MTFNRSPDISLSKYLKVQYVVEFYEIFIFFPFLDDGVPRSTSYGVYISLMFLALHPMEFRFL